MTKNVFQLFTNELLKVPMVNDMSKTFLLPELHLAWNMIIEVILERLGKNCNKSQKVLTAQCNPNVGSPAYSLQSKWDVLQKSGIFQYRIMPSSIRQNYDFQFPFLPTAELCGIFQ